MSMTIPSVEVVMETVPFSMKHYLDPRKIDLGQLENIIKEIIRKAMKFGLIEYDRAVKLEKGAREIAENIIETLKTEAKYFCEPARRMIRKVVVFKRNIDISIGSVNLRFVIVNDGENCGIRLIEIK